jgi:hypothetical protein
MVGGREVEGEGKVVVLLLRSSEVQRQEKHGPSKAKKSKEQSRASPLTHDELPSIHLLPGTTRSALMDRRRIR